jgi:hypothetical protein
MPKGCGERAAKSNNCLFEVSHMPDQETQSLVTARATPATFLGIGNLPRTQIKETPSPLRGKEESLHHVLRIPIPVGPKNVES